MEPTSEPVGVEGALTVKLRVFEGPLDLLLHLIKINKLDIYDIPIAEIARQYLEYLEMMKDLSLDIASEFLVMAATLAHIKSRMLLPVHEEADEEEDPRRELVEQLLEYQRYKEASLKLRELHARRSLLFGRSPDDEPPAREETVMGVSLFDLLTVFREAMASAKEGAVMVLPPDRFTVVDMMQSIVERLGREDRIAFRSLFSPGSPRGQIVALFLALLELVRLRMIHVGQAGAGAEIYLNQRSQ